MGSSSGQTRANRRWRKTTNVSVYGRRQHNTTATKKGKPQELCYHIDIVIILTQNSVTIYASTYMLKTLNRNTIKF